MSDTFQKKVLDGINRELIEIRKERGIPIAEIAMMTNLSMETIINMEKGNQVSFDKYRKLLRFLGKRIEVKVVDIE